MKSQLVQLSFNIIKSRTDLFFEVHSKFFLDSLTQSQPVHNHVKFLLVDCIFCTVKCLTDTSYHVFSKEELYLILS